MWCVQGRKQERAWKQASDEHATALLAVEAGLAGKQQEVAGLQDLNTRLFSRFQDMREQLARSEEKVSREKIRGVFLHTRVIPPSSVCGCVLACSCVSGSINARSMW